MKKSLFIASMIVIVICIGICILYVMYRIKNKPFYTAEDFGITVIKSKKDQNHNGIDDYTDILLGARKDAENKPTYKSAYYAGGYPPKNEGVCADVIWRAFQNAGYTLKDMVEKDIKENTKLYPAVETPDSNIDFRRVRNLKVFFDRFADIVTNDIREIAQWQPGDIVIFEPDYSHIGIISDKRNEKGVPYLIHNYGQWNREEDVLESMNISAHYRFI